MDFIKRNPKYSMTRNAGELYPLHYLLFKKKYPQLDLVDLVYEKHPKAIKHQDDIVEEMK